METSTATPASLNWSKRSLPDHETADINQHSPRPLNLTGSQFLMPMPLDVPDSSLTSSNDQAKEPSPALSISALRSLSNEPKSCNIPVTSLISLAQPTPESSAPPPAKRRKLAAAEKEEQKHEKEIKNREKAEQKAKRGDEKRVRDMEKQQKNAEKEVKRRERELEEERKSQEKIKKERRQMRLGAFFQKPSTPAKSLSVTAENMFDKSLARRRSLSLERFDAVVDDIRVSQSPTRRVSLAAKITPEVINAMPAVSDYRQYFLKFELGTHSKLATSAGSQRDPQELEHALSVFDMELNDPSLREKYDLGIVGSYCAIEQHFAGERMFRRGAHQPKMRQLIESIGSSSQVPIDLTEDSHVDPLDRLQFASRRYLHFDQDVRPPYFGTYTKISSHWATSKLRRNPHARIRTDTDYDYDSEAEWEEPEEGEEILDEQDDEDESIGDADEMDGFLDDEYDALKDKRRRLIGGDLVPISTGLCWEDESGKILPSTEGADVGGVMLDMKMGFLVPESTSAKTIDPLSTVYWPMAPPATSKPVMQQMRSPLLDVTNITNNFSTELITQGATEGIQGPIRVTCPTQSKPGRKPALKSMSMEDLSEFRKVVEGSNVSKIELCKALKQKFPKHTNELIKETVGAHFAHVGAHRNEKKWIWFEAS